MSPFKDLPRGALAMVYDEVDGTTSPGYWKDNLKAITNPSIKLCNYYGGSIEFYCQGFLDSKKETTCVYPPDPNANVHVYFPQANRDSGKSYNNYACFATFDANVADDPSDPSSPTGPQFDKLKREDQQKLADALATQIWSDDNLRGAQVDIEPFDASQVPFYEQLSKNLLGENPNIPKSNPDKPRYFTLFAGANGLSAEVWKALGPNGFFTMSGYDLGGGGAGVASQPTDFGDIFESQVQKVIDSAETSDGYFRVAVPCAAATTEFDKYTPEKGQPVTGYPQIQYIDEAIKRMNCLNLQSNSRFLGISIWAWTTKMAWPAKSNNRFTPAAPPPETITALQKAGYFD